MKVEKRGLEPQDEEEKQLSVIWGKKSLREWKLGPNSVWLPWPTS